MTKLTNPEQKVQLTGVTGHRDLEETDRVALERVVHVCLAEIERLQPAPIHHLICGLADGADQLVARCALERGWTLHAVLAAPLDIYAQTMSETASHHLRQDLLPRCAEVTVMAHAKSASMADYVAVRDAITGNASALIAVWDGSASRGEGGTADTVQKFLQDRSHHTEEANGDRPVYWVRTRRRGEPLPPPGPAWQRIERTHQD